MPFSARLSQTKATADSWFSGGEKRKEKPTDKHRLRYHMQMLFFLPFPFPFFFPLCTLLEGASRALNMQLLCHYCQPGCLSASRRLNALPPPALSLPPPPRLLLLHLPRLPLQVIIQSATRRPSNRKLTATPGYVGSVSLQSPPRSGPAYLSVSHTFRWGGGEGVQCVKMGGVPVLIGKKNKTKQNPALFRGPRLCLQLEDKKNPTVSPL